MTGNVAVMPIMPSVKVMGKPTAKIFICGAMRVITPMVKFTNSSSAIMGKALRENEARLGPDHPSFKRFSEFSMGLMEKARKGESTAPGERMAILEEFNSIYRDITGGDIPHYETMKADLKDKAPA